MIAGPANFPVRAKEKQNAESDTNMREWRHIQGLLDKIRSTGMGGISADDPNAVKKL
jgi:DNA gyrase inhibitor GyrI